MYYDFWLSTHTLLFSSLPHVCVSINEGSLVMEGSLVRADRIWFKLATILGSISHVDSFEKQNCTI